VNGCDNLSGDIVPIVNGLDPDVDVVVPAHTHQPYICDVNGKVLTSASSFGRLFTDIDLTIDHRSKNVSATTARNVIVTSDLPNDPDQTKLVEKYAPSQPRSPTASSARSQRTSRGRRTAPGSRRSET
jgi:5'-nucleotidase